MLTFQGTGLGGYIDRERGDAVMATAAETKNENEYFRMKAAELEKVEIMKNKIMDLIDNSKQGYGDIVLLSHDDKSRAVAQNKWVALDDLQKQINQLGL